MDVLREAAIALGGDLAHLPILSGVSRQLMEDDLQHGPPEQRLPWQLDNNNFFIFFLTKIKTVANLS